ncbi:MAG: PDC sensor domain-containing protein [Deltaproteobacteria bacterium]|nr:PDC sensor domain-containing protein [Deltaproteobacteria bacterium]
MGSGGTVIPGAFFFRRRRFYISKLTGVLCITVSAPIVDERDEMVGFFGVDIKFEDWIKRAEDITEATRIALRGEG